MPLWQPLCSNFCSFLAFLRCESSSDPDGCVAGAQSPPSQTDTRGQDQGSRIREGSAGAAIGVAASARPAASTRGAHAARARSAGDEQVRQSIAGGSLAGSGHRGRARRKSRAWPRGGAASVRACVVHSVFIAAASFCERCGAPCSASAAGAQSRADQRDQRGQRPERDGGGPSRSVMSPS